MDGCSKGLSEKRPWYRKKLFVIPSVFFLALSIYAAVEALTTPPDYMPDVVGMSYKEAKSRLPGLEVSHKDIRSDRIVVNHSNWKVVSQSISPGKEIAKSDEVVLGLEKFSDPPIKSESTSLSSEPQDASPKSLTPLLGDQEALWSASLESAGRDIPGVSATFGPCPSADGWDYSVTFTNGRVVMINYEPCDEKQFTLDQAEESSRAFLPEDTKFVTDFRTSASEPARRFYSESLSMVVTLDPAIAASANDCAGNDLPPGTVWLVPWENNGWALGFGGCP